MALTRAQPRSLRDALLRAPFLALGAAAGAWLAAGAGCGSGDAMVPPSGKPSATIVEIVRLEPGLLRNVVEIPGQLTAEMAVEVKPEREGVIAAIGFREGQGVKAGDVLFRLRDDEQRARLHEAEAELALTEAVHRRTRDLANRDVSSAAQLERAAAERDVARARLERSRVEVARMRIRAPFDGVMGALHVSPGDRVETDQALVRIDAIDRVQLVFHLPEAAVGVVKPGAPVEIRVAPFPGELFSGEVYFVSPTLDPRTRHLLIKAWLPNPDHRLRPGLFAQIEVEVERREDALLVPESSLMYAVDGTFVWRVTSEDKAERVPIEVGLHSGDRVEVRAGLAPGERVVAVGVHKVKAGGLLEGVAPAEATRALPAAGEHQAQDPGEAAPGDPARDAS